MNNNIPFIQQVDEMGHWDVNQLIDDIRTLYQTTGCDWDQWKKINKISNGSFVNSILHDSQGYLNLTYNPGLTTSLEERLWSFSGRKNQERNDVADGDLHTLQPELKGTYIEKLFNKFNEVLGPVRMRLHNKANRYGLYWHRDMFDERSSYRYHLPLWTNPGHFLVWSTSNFKWMNGYDPKECESDIPINAQFMPVSGYVSKVATGLYTHGVSSIDVGWNGGKQLQSRCHIIVIPIKPSNKHSPYIGNI